MVQASLVIAPSNGERHTSTLPARHSKSLDQLRINTNNTSTLPRSIQTHYEGFPKPPHPKLTYNGDNRRRESDTSKKQTKPSYYLNKNPIYYKSSSNLEDKTSAVSEPNQHQSLTLPRPILPSRDSYSSGKYTRTSSSAPNPYIVHSAPIRQHIPRSNSTHIFPHTNNPHLENLFQNNTLNSRVPPHRVKTHQSYRDKRRITTDAAVALPQSANNLLDLSSYEGNFYNRNKKEHQYTQQQQQVAIPHNKICANNLIKTSNQSASRQKLSERVHRLITSEPNSSSTDSDSNQNGIYKRLEGSASVPNQLARTTGEALRHARSAASVLEDSISPISALSESLPNLAPPPPAFVSSPLTSNRSLSSTGSTSSLTSEQSGWVSYL